MEPGDQGKPPRGDRRTIRHQATRREILAAAWENVRRRGMADLSLREVADEVGMRGPSLYVYFKSKHDIYDAMFSEASGQLLGTLDQSERPGRPAPEALLAAAQGFFDFCTADPARYQLLFERPIPGYEPSPEAYSVAVKVFGLTRARLASLGVDTPEAVDLWTALMTGMTSQQIADDPDGDRWRRLLGPAVDMFLAHNRRMSAQP